MRDWVDNLIDTLSRSNGNRNAVLASYMKQTGLSLGSLYRRIKERGWDSGRTARKDRGTMKTLTQGQLDVMAGLVHVTRREIKGAIMPAGRAMEITEDNGIIDPGSVSVSTVRRHLRQNQISSRMLNEPTPYTPLRSLHPNHVHEFDVSVCIQYYFKGGLRIMREDLFYRNKIENYVKIKDRLLRYALTDHFSGTIFFRYYYAGGETELNLLRYFMEAWGKKEDERLPFHGVPRILLMDKGSANHAAGVKSFLKELEVEIPEGMPHKPRRQGQVENAHNIIEENFESGLKIQPATDEARINSWAMDWLIKYNATQKHRRHGMTRTACWLLIKEDQLRILPSKEKCQDLMVRPTFTRVVNPDYTISYKNNFISVKHIEGIRPGVMVTCHILAFRDDVINVIYQDKTYECPIIPRLPAHLGGFRSDAAIIGQEYKAQPETLTQQAMKRFDNMAYGEDRKKDQVPFEGLQVFGIHADKIDQVGNLAYLEKKGTPIEVDRAIVEKSISITRFLKELSIAIGQISPELNQELRARYGESIDKEEAERAIEDIRQGRPQTSDLRLINENSGSEVYGLKSKVQGL